MPIHQFFKNDFSFPDQFCSESESCIHRHVRGRNCVVLCTRFLQHCTKLLCTPVSLAIRDLNNPFSSYFLELPSSTIKIRIHAPLAVRKNLPSPAPSGPNFNEKVFTAAPVSKFIFTHSNRFGLLVPLTSKPPSENELAEVSYVCSQPSGHPTPIRSSFHSSTLQPSFHSSEIPHESTTPQWYKPVPSELIPDFPSPFLISKC